MSQKVGAVLRDAIAQLTPMLGPDAVTDARVLMAEVLGVSRGGLAAKTGDAIPADAKSRFEKMINQRLAFQPIAQIIGRREFWGRDFIVTPDVLDPRPDTEILVERALSLPKSKTILDLGTGTGCILLTLLKELPAATGIGVDISPRALAVAERNQIALGLSDRAELRLGSWFSPVSGKFDLITCNPPYIAKKDIAGLDRDVRDWEPALALSPGEDGLLVYRMLAQSAAAYLTATGILLAEIGFDQADSVFNLFRAENWQKINIHKDLGGNYRVLEACFH